MAEGKDKIIFYKNWCTTFQKLTPEEAGNLIKHLCNYVTDKDPEPVDRMTELLFDPIKDTLKRDLKKWEQTTERNRSNGLKGGRPKNPEEPSGLMSVNSETQANPKKGDKDKDKDSVTVKDNVIDIVKEKETKLLCSIIDINELDDQTDRITFSFWQLFKSNLQEAGIKKTTNLDKATLEKWRIPIRKAINIDERTESEFKEVWKFLGSNEFWKKNIQSTTKLREQFERLLVEARTKPPTKEDKHKLTDEYKARLAEKLRS